MGATSRRKGSKYERNICRVLSEWWCERSFKGIRAEDLPFRRTPLSGGWEKGSDVRPTEYHIEKLWPFSVECKNHKNWDWFTLIEGSQSSPIMHWWAQCVEAANNQNKVPMLIFTQNRRKDFVLIYKKDLESLRLNPPVKFIMDNGKDNLVFFLLDHLVSTGPTNIKLIMENKLCHAEDAVEEGKINPK